MSDDPLLSDNLAVVLGQFPNNVLHGIISILREHTSFSPFPARRAKLAHAAEPDHDLHPHVPAIVEEILWWGSNEIHRQLGEQRDWPTIVLKAARQLGVPKKDADSLMPAWRIEHMLLQKALSNWEVLSPEQRDKAIRKSAWSLEDGAGGFVAAAGTFLKLAQPIALRA